MQLELGAEVDQSLVAERLQGAVSYHGTQQLEVSHKDVQCGEVDVNVLPPLKVFFIPVDSVDSLLYLTDVAQIWLEVAVPVIAGGFWGVDLVVQQRHRAAPTSSPLTGTAQFGAGSLQEVLAVSRKVLSGVFHVSSPQQYCLVEQLGLGLQLLGTVTWTEL